MAFTNFLGRKLADGREWMELLPFIVLFVMHRFRRVYLLNLRRSTFCYQGAAQWFSLKSLYLKVGQDRSCWLMSLIRSYCLEQLGVFVGASNFMCIRFVDGQRDNMPWDRKFIKERSPWNLFRLRICCTSCGDVVTVCRALSAFNISEIGCWIRKQITYRRSIASEV